MGSRASPKNKNVQAKRDTIGSIVFLSLVVIGIIAAIIYNSGLFGNLLSGDRKINTATGKAVRGVADLEPDIIELQCNNDPCRPHPLFSRGCDEQENAPACGRGSVRGGWDTY